MMNEETRDFAAEIAEAERRYDARMFDKTKPPMAWQNTAAVLATICDLQRQYIAELVEQQRGAYEFMRIEVNRLETNLSTARIGLGQAQKVAQIAWQLNTNPCYEVLEIVKEALELSE